MLLSFNVFELLLQFMLGVVSLVFLYLLLPFLEILFSREELLDLIKFIFALICK